MIASAASVARRVPAASIGQLDFDRGRILECKGSLDGAIAEYREALRFKPNDPEAHYNLANVLRATGDLDGAITENREAIRLKPEHALAHNNLALALAGEGDLDSAIAEYYVAMQIKPSLFEPYNDLAWILATAEREDLRNPEEAVRLARHAIALLPTDGRLWNTLGAALYRVIVKIGS